MDPDRLEKITTVFGKIFNIRQKDKYQTVLSKGFDSDFDKITEDKLRKVVYELNNHFKKNGKKGLDVAKLRKHSWRHSDGSSSSIFLVKKGKIRLLYSFILDEPDSLMKKPIFYLHAVYVKKKPKQYSSYVSRIVRDTKENFIFGDVSGQDIEPERVLDEVWKTKETLPYMPINDNDLTELKKLAMNSEMAILPTSDQIQAMFGKERPLFINGQAGTGKTTGISFILLLIIPQIIMNNEPKRIMVTAMTETVVSKLENNTSRAFEAHHKKLEDIFLLEEDDIIKYINRSRYNKNKWYQVSQIGENGEITSESGPDIVYIDFREILRDIILLSQEQLFKKIAELDSLIDNPKNCDNNFDISNPDEIDNRKNTCEFCKDNPSFHHDFRQKDKDFDAPYVQEKIRLRSRMNSIKENIIKNNVDSTVSFSKFLIDFFEPRRNDFQILPEFAWYGIRTLIKGTSVKNNYRHLKEEDFTTKIEPSICQDFEGKVPELYKCYNKYTSWLKENNFRDDIDIATDVAFLLNNFPGLIENKFDYLFLDEAQDLTNVEYQVLISLLNEINRMQIVLAGDPLQTINPTGFDWDRMKDLMYETLDSKPYEPHVLNHNHRTPSTIVDLSNEILDLRGKILRNENIKKQKVHEPGKKPVLTFLSPKGDIDSVDAELLSEFVSTKSSYKVAVRKTDETGLNDLLKNDGIIELRDDVLNNFLTVTEIKGDEGEIIVLYRTGEMDPKDLNLLLAEENDLRGIDSQTRIRLKFIVNQLYILTTRSTQSLYIVENDEHKGRIWTKLFGDKINIVENPNDLLRDIITISDENFDLKDYLENQLKLWNEQEKPKFLERGKDKSEEIKEKQRHLNSTELLLYNKICAEYYNYTRDYEKAGDFWKKIQEEKKAFACYVKGGIWEKARSSSAVDSKRYSIALKYLENKLEFNSNDIHKLFVMLTETMSGGNHPKWLIDVEFEMSQFVFDWSIDARLDWPKGVLNLKTDLSRLRLFSQLNKESISKLCSDLKANDKFGELKELIDEIKATSLLFDVTKFDLYILEKELENAEPYSENQSKILVKLLDFEQKDDSRYKYWVLLASNVLEDLFRTEQIDDFEKIPGKIIGKPSMNIGRIDLEVRRRFMQDSPTIRKNSGKYRARDILLMFGFVPDIEDDEKSVVTSLVDTYNLITNLVKDDENQGIDKDFESGFGPNTLENLKNETIISGIRTNIIKQLIKVGVEDLVSSKNIIDAYTSFDWRVEDWGYKFGEIYSKITEYSGNNNLIRRWKEWFKLKISDDRSYSDPRIGNIISSIVGTEKQWELESIAKEVNNTHLISRIEMENIRLSDISGEAELIIAKNWFFENNMRDEEMEVLAKLPDNLTKEIEDSLKLEITQFVKLIRLVLSSKDSESNIVAISSKIDSYSKKFILHEHLSLEEINALLKYIDRDVSDLGEFWFFLNQERYKLFKHYAQNNNVGAIERALYKITNEVSGNLSTQGNIGLHYSFLSQRWDESEQNGEYGIVFAEASLCSLVFDIIRKKMTVDRLIELSKKLNGIESPRLKKSKVVESILKGYNKKMDIVVDETFIESISKHV